MNFDLWKHIFCCKKIANIYIVAWCNMGVNNRCKDIEWMWHCCETWIARWKRGVESRVDGGESSRKHAGGEIGSEGARCGAERPFYAYPCCRAMTTFTSIFHMSAVWWRPGYWWLLASVLERDDTWRCIFFVCCFNPNNKLRRICLKFNII